MLMYGLEVIAIGVLMLMEIFLKEWSSSTLHKAMILILRKMYELFILCDGGSGSKKSCLVIFKDLNEPESLLFTECQNLISFKSYCNFNFGTLGSLKNFWKKK